jgi:hypothetical protein
LNEQQPIVIEGFPIDAEMGLKKHFTHFDINVTISNHGRSKYDYDYKTKIPHGGTWCYYVTVSEQMLSAEQFAEFWLEPAAVTKRSNGWDQPSYAYYNAKFADADWHGGVTFYEKLGGIDGEPRAVKIGCDFAHYWDEGHSFDYAQVEREAKATVDKLRDMYQFFRRCPYNGKWQPEAEMVEHKGKLWSKEGVASSEKYDRERGAKGMAA